MTPIHLNETTLIEDGWFLTSDKALGQWIIHASDDAAVSLSTVVSNSGRFYYRFDLKPIADLIRYKPGEPWCRIRNVSYSGESSRLFFEVADNDLTGIEGIEIMVNHYSLVHISGGHATIALKILEAVEGL